MHTGPKSTSFGANIRVKDLFLSRAFRSESSAIDEPESQIPSPFNFGTNFWALTDLVQIFINDFSTKHLRTHQRTRPPIKDKTFFS